MTFDVDKDLIFELVMKKPKTNIYQVINKQQNSVIGMIKWYPSWRHYCFFPYNNTVYSDRCMIKIGEFVEKSNKEHSLSKTLKPKVSTSPRGEGT